MHTRRQRTGQETRARAEQTQAPLAANLVEQRAVEESLHHPVMNQIEGALTGNCLVGTPVSCMTQLSHEGFISHVTNTC